MILMDEATISADFETDKAIQKSISTKLSGSTLHCIAPRLQIVIEYDPILAFCKGPIVEFDRQEFINKVL
ncbi:hypothetical protein G6F43_012312 [Rhizopus delemar]|nr:hypothetical protein G6F43_012312 [Rhizopus delemar]